MIQIEAGFFFLPKQKEREPVCERFCSHIKAAARAALRRGGPTSALLFLLLALEDEPVAAAVAAFMACNWSNLVLSMFI